MALSDDQRAMLRLLAQREQGYEDIGALMGLSVDEVRAKVKEALAEVDSGDAPGAKVAEPTPPPKAPEPPKAVEPPSPPKIPEPEQAPTPATPAPPLPAAAPPSPSLSKPSPRARPRVSLPTDRRRLVEWLAGAALVILVVLFATGTIDLGGGGSDSSSTTVATTTSSESAGRSTTASNSSQATKAVLTPVDGGDAAGLALFGRIKKTAVLQVEAKGLDPSAKGQSYTVWLYRSPKLVLRVGAVAVGKAGTIAAQFPVPAQVLAYVAGGAFDQIDISLTDNSTYDAEVAKAKQQKRLPAYTGTDVLRGKITGPAIKKN